ncbi:MAG: hypothetical protein K2W95_25245 [Candidatus Obscuribacterales bacterium]|nr:hypothetical protein [Candidatus Obscuribacterales bacterium]
MPIDPVPGAFAPFAGIRGAVAPGAEIIHSRASLFLINQRKNNNNPAQASLPLSLFEFKRTAYSQAHEAQQERGVTADENV